MTWLKVSIETENIEEVCTILSAHGIDGVEIIDPVAAAEHLAQVGGWDYLDDDLLVACPPVVRYFVGAASCRPIPDIGNLGKVTAEVVEDDWSDAWLQYYKPFKIGDRIVIRPHWEDYEPADGEVVFAIDPGHVFGTGQHQSTALCIQLLDKHVAGGERVLDVGCGSGILGIIAMLLGADHATAVDIDPAAVDMTFRNAELNNVVVNAICANLLDNNYLVQGKFDIVVANIVADVIIKLAPIAAGLMVDGGKFIASGIVDNRTDEVVATLAAAGFMNIEVTVQDNWVAICTDFS